VVETATEHFGRAAALPRDSGVDAPTAAAEAAETAGTEAPPTNAQMASSRFHSVGSESFSQTS
jgi:hypothetical protein